MTTKPLPEWGERLLGQMEARGKEPRRRDRPAVALKVPIEWYKLIREAARSRDLTMAAYARRSVMAMVCRDLGLDWRETMLIEPGVQDYDTQRPVERVQGAGHGPWVIEEVREA